MIDRRSFMGLGALAVAAAACRPVAAAATCCAAKRKVQFKFGMAGYSCNRLSTDETLDLLKRLDIKYLCVKAFHLPFESTDAQIAEFKQKCADHGVTPYAIGPIYDSKPEDVRTRFEFAKRLGVKTVVGVPFERFSRYFLYTLSPCRLFSFVPVTVTLFPRQARAYIKAAFDQSPSAHSFSGLKH